MYVTCLERQSFCHALRRNLKFKLLYFQNKECYPAENKQADGNLDFLISKLIFKKVATEIEHILRLSKLKEYASH